MVEKQTKINFIGDITKNKASGAKSFFLKNKKTKALLVIIVIAVVLSILFVVNKTIIMEPIVLITGFNQVLYPEGDGMVTVIFQVLIL